MPIEFKNIRQQAYYIKSKKTKKGNTTYFMTRKKDEKCLDKIPQGYEVFERYDTGMMYIRKMKKSNFQIHEIKIIENELEANQSIIGYKLDINGDQIKIYVAEKEENERIAQTFDDSFLLQKIRFSEKFKRFDEKIIINIKVSKQGKEFEIMRFCYLGSVDDWIVIDTGNNLELLTKKYLIHLGKESYYELF